MNKVEVHNHVWLDLEYQGWYLGVKPVKVAPRSGRQYEKEHGGYARKLSWGKYGGVFGLIAEQDFSLICL